MSYVIAAPEIMTSAATDLATIGSNVSAAHMAAAAPTVALVPAAADEVSASIAHLFSQHGQGYQAVAAQAAAFHEQFVQNLTASAGSYASIETAINSYLQGLLFGVGGYLIGGIGSPGLFPTIAFQIASNPLTPLIWPIYFPLLPLLIVYLAETQIGVNGI
jgi:PE family